MKMFGIIFDVDNPHYLIELKHNFAKFIGGLDYEDRVYIFSNDAIDVPHFKGESIAKIISLKVHQFSLPDAIKHTYYVLANDLNEDEYEKFIIIISDRVIKNTILCRALDISNRTNIPVKFIFYTINKSILLPNEIDLHVHDQPSFELII
jgi:hypothetical protein